MAIVRIAAQDAQGSTASATTTTTYPFTPTAGNTLIACHLTSVDVNILTMPAGWTKLVDQTISSATVNSVSIWYKLAGQAEPTAIIVNATAATKLNTHLYEYSGIRNPLITEGPTSAQSGTTVATLASPNVVTAYDDDLIFAAWGLASTVTLPSVTGNLNIRQQDAANLRLFDGDLITTVPGTYSGTGNWTTAVRVGVAIAAFRAARSNGFGNEENYLRVGDGMSRSEVAN